MKISLTILFYCIALIGWSQTGTLSLESIKGYAFPTELTACAQGSKIAWAVDEQGKRNVYVAEGPDFKARKITHFDQDTGQEISSLTISDDGKSVVFVRGGDHGSNWNGDLPVNPGFSLSPEKVSLYSVPFAGGEAVNLSEGDFPSIRATSDSVTFLKAGQIWIVSIAGGKARNLFTVRGRVESQSWSPDASLLSFVAERGDHALIGIYNKADRTVKYLSPSFNFDRSPQWSPDGKRLAFIRTPGEGGEPDTLLVRIHRPWSIMVADISTGESATLWTAPKTLPGSLPTTHGGTNLHWAAFDRITFLSYHDGWPHLYSIPAAGGKELLLTEGKFMAEYIKLSADRTSLVFCGNVGPDANDVDRRHIVRVAVDKPGIELLTPGTGLEWTPTITGDGKTVVFLSATAQRPPWPAMIELTKSPRTSQLIATDAAPKDYPSGRLVVPKPVTFMSSDGFTIHGQLFEGVGNGKKPAIVYVHGGPPRQMLLGWHYSDYYSNAYAINQYLASLGFTVLTVNYRLGIGYGYDFHQPAQAGPAGASEYNDVKAAGLWLRSQPGIDPSRIGIYGGSYGGFLTAMALARDSKLFAAGVDIHGVHDWTTSRFNFSNQNRFEKIPALESTIKTAWASSPVAYIGTWTSPVSLIHGDDDRNVAFNQSTDLYKRLLKQGVPVETTVIVDDTHHWLKFSNALKVDHTIADYFVRKFLKK